MLSTSVENQKGRYVPLRTRRVLSSQTLYSDSVLLVLHRTSLNLDNTLLVLNWQYILQAFYMGTMFWPETHLHENSSIFRSICSGQTWMSSGMYLELQMSPALPPSSTCRWTVPWKCLHRKRRTPIKDAAVRKDYSIQADTDPKVPIKVYTFSKWW